MGYEQNGLSLVYAEKVSQTCFTIYFQCGDASEVANSTKPAMAPFLIFNGCLEEPGEQSVAAENKLILPDATDIIKATELLMFWYYVCNLEYPKECFNTFFFLQRHALKVFDTQYFIYISYFNF